MNDEIKELITLAAKAMGTKGFWYEEMYEDYLCSGILCEDFEGIPAISVWNPYTSDSDCFRMETELEIDVEWNYHYGENVYVAQQTVFASKYNIGNELIFFQEYTTDKAAARRLASLRVAAEIGRRME